MADGLEPSAGREPAPGTTVMGNNVYIIAQGDINNIGVHGSYIGEIYAPPSNAQGATQADNARPSYANRQPETRGRREYDSPNRFNQASSSSTSDIAGPSYFDRQPERRGRLEYDSPNRFNPESLSSTSGWYQLSEQIYVCNSKPLKGGAQVYQGSRYHNGDWHDIAVKLIPHDEESLKEVKLHHKLGEHPNVIRMYDTGVSHLGVISHIYIAMELCSQTLKDHVEECKDKPLDFEKYFNFAKQIVSGVAFIHDGNILHRDIKLDNILLSLTKDSVRVADLGLSKYVVQGHALATVSVRGVGSDGFRAPELLYEKPRASFRSDSFSIGIALAMLFSRGRHPFGLDPSKWRSNICDNKQYDLTHIMEFERPFNNKRALLIDLINQCLRRNPNERPTPKEMLKHGFFSNPVKENRVRKRDKESLVQKVTALQSAIGSNTTTETQVRSTTKKRLLERFQALSEPGSSDTTGSPSSNVIRDDPAPSEANTVVEGSGLPPSRVKSVGPAAAKETALPTVTRASPAPEYKNTTREETQVGGSKKEKLRKRFDMLSAPGGTSTTTGFPNPSSAVRNDSPVAGKESPTPLPTVTSDIPVLSRNTTATAEDSPPCSDSREIRAPTLTSTTDGGAVESGDITVKDEIEQFLLAKKEKVDRLEKELGEALKSGKGNHLQILVKLKELHEKDDLDTVLQLAEHELVNSMTDQCLKKVKRIISDSGSRSTLDVRNKGYSLQQKGKFVQALILYIISHDLHKDERKCAPHVELEWIKDRITDITAAIDPLINQGGTSREVAKNFGKKHMQVLIGELRAVTGADPSLKALREISCLVNITGNTNHIRDHETCIKYGEEGVTMMTDRFGDGAFTYKDYGKMLNNLGNAYGKIGKLEKAEECYIKAIRVHIEAQDYENAEKRQKDIDSTAHNLEKLQSDIAGKSEQDK